MAAPTAATTAASTTIPAIPARTNILDERGRLTRTWFIFFEQLAGAVGGIGGSVGGTRKFSTTFVSETTVTVTHNLGTIDIVVMVWDADGDQQILPETVVLTSINVVTLTFGVAVSGNVVVIG